MRIVKDRSVETIPVTRYTETIYWNWSSREMRIQISVSVLKLKYVYDTRNEKPILWPLFDPSHRTSSLIRFKLKKWKIPSNGRVGQFLSISIFIARSPTWRRIKSFYLMRLCVSWVVCEKCNAASALYEIYHRFVIISLAHTRYEHRYPD
jgi:hypothetical protein